MNTIYKLIFGLLLSLPLFLSSCTDEDNMELNKGSEPLAIKADKNEVTLDVLNPENNAISFDWTTGSNQGTNAAITYLFELDIKGNNFADPVSIDLGRNIFSQTYKMEEFNNLLLNTFGQEAGNSVELEARVTATIYNDNVKPEISAPVIIKVTTYKPVSKALYLIGDATPNGWSADNATPLTKVTSAPGGFTWTGKLTPGKFKFITTLGEFTPSYNKGADNSKLYFRENGDDPYDEQFEITEGGSYKITLNIITLAFHIEKGAGPEYTELWFVGNPSGWSFKAMTVDALDPYVFHYNADLSAGGEFKIATKADFDASVVFLRPAIDKTPAGTNLDVVKWSENERPGGENDYKWDISGGIYKISLDTRLMKIDIVPFTPFAMIYLVGEATPNGWDIGNSTPMTATSNPHVFTWTGALKTGELKFTCDKKSDWNGAWFTATEANKAPSDDVQQMVFSNPGAGLDNKWKIDTAGTYSIELDQLKETVIIKKI